MIRVKVAREKLKKVTGAIEVILGKDRHGHREKAFYLRYLSSRM